MNSQRAQKLVDQFLDDPAGASYAEIIKLVEISRMETECAELLRRTLDTEVILRGMDSQFDIADDVMAALEEEDSQTSKVVPFALPWKVGAAAAAALLLVSVMWWSFSSGETVAWVNTSGEIKIIRDGIEVTLDAAGTMQASDRIQVPDSGRADWKYSDDTLVKALPGTEFVYSPDLDRTNSASKRLQLVSGGLEAEVAPQQSDAPFVIETPHARAVVRGTKFTLTSSGSRSRLSVDEGSVDLIGATGEKVTVSAGESGVAMEGKVLGKTSIPVKPVALYTFESGRGNVVRDRSNVLPALDLVPSVAENRLDWGNDGIQLGGEHFLASVKPAAKIIESCQRSGEVTFEAWITPKVEAQGGPARIITLTRGSGRETIMLAQGQYQVDPAPGYVGVTPTDQLRGAGGNFLSGPGSPPKLTHVVFTHAKNGKRVLFIDGKQVAEDMLPGSFSNWRSGFPISVGGDLDGENAGGVPRNWRGVIHLIAVYPAALKAGDVERLFQVGPVR